MTQKTKIGMIMMFSMISVFSFLSSFHSIPVKAAATSKETTSNNCEMKNDEQGSKVVIITDGDSKDAIKDYTTNTEKTTQTKSTDKMEDDQLKTYILIGVIGILSGVPTLYGCSKTDYWGALLGGWVLSMTALINLADSSMNWF